MQCEDQFWSTDGCSLKNMASLMNLQTNFASCITAGLIKSLIVQVIESAVEYISIIHTIIKIKANKNKTQKNNVHSIQNNKYKGNLI